MEYLGGGSCLDLVRLPLSLLTDDDGEALTFLAS